MPHPTINPKKHERVTRLLQDAMVVILTLLAPSIGGAKDLWLQSLVVFCAALIVFWRPPTRLLLWPLTLFSIALVALAFLAFLPRDWLGQLTWLRDFEQQCQITLPPTATPQPWLTLKR